jgi:hypothetical protein
MRDASPSGTATVRTESTATATATVSVAAMLAEIGWNSLFENIIKLTGILIKPYCLSEPLTSP